MWVWVCLFIGTCTRRSTHEAQWLSFSVLLYYFLPHVSRQGFSLSVELADSAKLAVRSRGPRDPLVAVPAPRLEAHTAPLYSGIGKLSWVPVLMRQSLTHRAFSQALRCTDAEVCSHSFLFLLLNSSSLGGLHLTQQQQSVYVKVLTQDPKAHAFRLIL